MNKTSITREDWLSALADAMAPQDDDQAALTVREFADLYHLGRSAADRRLKVLLKQGRVTLTKKRVACTDGRIYPTVAYRLVRP